ncbi:MAG TPA: bifunctional DNA primase/polymerase [Streptosporangiaceae bacterium]|nr:bifunctional DNA primase/polymerase [Streptosporangiaceae bacterium]
MTDSPFPGAGGLAREWRHRSDRGYVLCAGTGEDVVLAFPYDAAMVREAKAIGGRRFDWSTRTNVYPFGRLPQVVAFADAHGIDVVPQIRVLVPAADAAGLREAARSSGQEVRDAAHLYLSYGLLPVPAWSVREDGACRCPRGGTCARPGKHPRSVATGLGGHDYSWRPLACATHEDVEQRFASNGRYAVANLMLAIPARMLVIDQDFDDGGRQALADLADRLGELPATLGHDTPHGTHRIFRTPPGWTTRAWVGKDARNPLPAGMDLRVPGQVLMASPSQVPTAEGTASYGPVVEASVADLPGAYVAAWTPPREPARVGSPPASVPLGRADAAATYVNARITGIAEDLAALKPGGRNTAIYTAALKIGSTIGVARSTPGAERAAAIWTDEAAEFALMSAAQENGYIADHSASAARSAIRSGLRTGLRAPRPLPDFGSHTAAPRHGVRDATPGLQDKGEQVTSPYRPEHRVRAVAQRDLGTTNAGVLGDARRFTYLDRFVAEYCHAMLWGSTEPLPRADESGHVDPSGICAGCNCEFSSRSRVMRAVREPGPAAEVPWPLAAFSAASRRSIESDCVGFVQANRADLDGLDPTQAGYDFAMSRNGSDLGFLRRGLGDQGDRLHLAAVSCGRSTAWADRSWVVHLHDEQAGAEDPQLAVGWSPDVSRGWGIGPGDRDLELEL